MGDGFAATEGDRRLHQNSLEMPYPRAAIQTQLMVTTSPIATGGQVVLNASTALANHDRSHSFSLITRPSVVKGRHGKARKILVPTLGMTV